MSQNKVNNTILEIEEKLKVIIINHLKLDIASEDINPEEEYFLDSFGFNSVDALELLLVIEREFDIEIADEDLDASLFMTLRSLSSYIERTLKVSRGEV